MARLPRLCIPGYPAHLRLRGNDGQPIFHDEGDRVFFHRTLSELVGLYELDVHAYVFMTNHVHLVATPWRPDSFARSVQGLGRRYVPRFNKVHQRTGTLWEGRFRSTLIESDRYLLACHRYVEENPVRAGMVANPGEHLWSSFRCNAWGARDDLVTAHSLYMELGSGEDTRLAAYRRLFDRELPEETIAAIPEATGWTLGSEEFCESMAALAGRRVLRACPLPRWNGAKVDSDPVHGQGTARTVAVG
jgi:putative transposase